MNLEAYLRDRAAQVEGELERVLPPAETMPPVIHQAMRYSALGGGKRLRGILALAAAEAVGGQGARALPLAAAIELIHAYSLVHDDLPCMDDDDLRRGKPTSHKVFGEGIAVLAGDALLTRAMEILVSLPELAGIEPATAVAVAREVARAAGTEGLIGGQVVDLLSEGDASADYERLLYVHSRKTGALFRAALRGGALLGGAGPAQLEPVTGFAEAFGLAFQITDDILNEVGAEEALGKAVGTDRERGKLTYPALFGLEEARRKAAQAAAEAQAAARALGSAGEVLAALAGYCVRRDR